MRKNYLKNLFKGAGILVLTLILSGCKEMVVLRPYGPIGQKEAELIYWAFALMLIVVVPVFIMVVWFAFRYRASNKKATYKPNWSDSNKIEAVIWGVPIAIIVILSVLTWVKTHELDPYKPIKSEVEPLRVEVISTDWNWLFVYPDDSVAVLNELVVEAGRPISFRLTSASVMTSFFIPHLGSQMYAMAGMQTQLNLMADAPGKYQGHNVEYSGNGYNSMHFDVLAKTPEDFAAWVKEAKQSPEVLSMEKYTEISQPNVGHPVTVYSSVVPGLFDKIMAPFMDWMGNMDMSHGEMHMEHHHHDMNMDMPENEHHHMNHQMSDEDMKKEPMEMNNKNMEEK